MQTLLQDLRFGVRMLMKRPGFTLIALASLAFGIGANTAIFSLINAAMLRPLPVVEPERLISLGNLGTGRMFPTFSYPNYKDFRDRNEILAGLIAYRFAPLSLSRDGVNERMWGYSVSGNYFEVLGVKPALGRMITPDDDRLPGAHPVVVVSYQYWQTRLGGVPDAIGKSLLVNGRSYAVIGVAPRGFFGTEIIAAPELWFPIAMQEQLEVGDAWLNERGTENLFLQGRLKPGVSVPQAQAALNGIAEQLEREFPEENQGKRVTLSPSGLMGGMMRLPVLGFVGLLMAVVGLVLVLACTNLANLLLARATERRREIAVRLALGASRWQLVRQLLTESVLLACAGGAVGLVLAFWLTDLAGAIRLPVDVPLRVDLHIDYRVLIFTGLLSVATGVLFGVLPAMQATKTDLTSVLKDEMSSGSLPRSWLKNGLIVFQVALSLMLLIAGGLVLRGLQRAQTLDPGFDPHNAIEVSFDLRLQGYDSARGREFQKQLLERVSALPDVQAAGLADLVPVDLHFGSQPVFIEGQSLERNASAPRILSNRISPGYFGAMGTQLLQGREFTRQDDESAPGVVIVNRTFAQRFWPGQEAIGKRFSLGSADSPRLQIIGIAQDGKYAGLNEDPKSFVYRPLWQSGIRPTTLIVRARTAPPQLMAAVRRELQQLDPNLPIASARTRVEQLSFPLLPARLAAGVMGSFGVLALVLAAIGLYGVMSYTVSRRTREIGVRMALGAEQTDVLMLIIRQGMMLTLAGTGIGLAVSLALTRVLKNLLFGVSATDPLTFTLIACLLIAVALLACWIPARRATKVDPMIALRCE